MGLLCAIGVIAEFIRQSRHRARVHPSSAMATRSQKPVGLFDEPASPLKRASAAREANAGHGASPIELLAKRLAVASRRAGSDDVGVPSTPSRYWPRCRRTQVSKLSDFLMPGGSKLLPSWSFQPHPHRRTATRKQRSSLSPGCAVLAIDGLGSVRTERAWSVAVFGGRGQCSLRQHGHDASDADLKWLIRPEGRQALDRLPATARGSFFPCREDATFLADVKKAGRSPSSAALWALQAAGRSPMGARAPSRPRWARPEQTDGDHQCRPSALSPHRTTATPVRSRR